MSELRRRLQAANVQWLANGAPHSLDFDDIYFAPEDGEQESRYVFIEHNDLPARWSRALHSFSIAETGFGTGLNFLLSAQLWQQMQSKQAQLHYFSVEKFPLLPQDLDQALRCFPGLNAEAERLQALYPPLVEGFHSMAYTGNITLHLLFGDAVEQLQQLRTSDRPELLRGASGIDCWFLDGFAPGKNEDMWCEQLLGVVGQLSHAGSSFSTFTAAGRVRRALQAAGFSVEKVKGFKGKREQLSGRFCGQPTASVYRRKRNFPAAAWYLPGCNPAARPGSVAVIGAGIAGCTSAAALARRGLQVSLYDSAVSLASGGSGVPQAALYARLSPYSSPLSDFALQAYQFSRHFYRDLFRAAGRELEVAGLLQLFDEPGRGQEAQLARQLNDETFVRAVSPQQCETLSGIALHKAALYYPDGLALSMSAVCEQLLRSAGITVQLRQAISRLSYQDSGWRLLDGQGNCLGQADAVVLCTAMGSVQFEQADWLPCRAIRGQLTLANASDSSTALRTVLCADSYITPAEDGRHCLGSSYVLDDLSTDLRDGEQQENLHAAQALLGEQVSLPGSAGDSAWAGVRCTTPDYLPVIGPAPRHQEFVRCYSGLQHDRNLPVNTAPPLWPGLYINTAYGSRGACLAPLGAEHLASQLSGQLSPLPARIRHALLPARFIIRNITRGHYASST